MDLFTPDVLDVLFQAGVAALFAVFALALIVLVFRWARATEERHSRIIGQLQNQHAEERKKADERWSETVRAISAQDRTARVQEAQRDRELRTEATEQREQLMRTAMQSLGDVVGSVGKLADAVSSHDTDARMRNQTILQQQQSMHDLLTDHHRKATEYMQSVWREGVKVRREG